MQYGNESLGKMWVKMEKKEKITVMKIDLIFFL